MFLRNFISKYDLPSKDMSKKSWELFNKQYNLTVSKDTLKEIVKKMNDLAGRDIKNICMLTSRYSQGMKVEQPIFDMFKLCATFRGKYSIGDEH